MFSEFSSLSPEDIRVIFVNVLVLGENFLFERTSSIDILTEALLTTGRG
jgi:hypothetical protein